jgi:hypothetical protein
MRQMRQLVLRRKRQRVSVLVLSNKCPPYGTHPSKWTDKHDFMSAVLIHGCIVSLLVDGAPSECTYHCCGCNGTQILRNIE